MSNRSKNIGTSFLLKRINKNADDILTLQSNSSSSNIITDSFCVIGGTTIIGFDEEEETPIYGTGKALGYSYDGITYYASPTPNILVNITNIDFNGYQWVATGYSSDNTHSLVLSSDGINWTTPFNNVFPNGISSIAWGNKKWVAIGFTNVGGPFIAYSYDGMTWEDTNYISIGYPTSIASNGSLFVIAAARYIAYSSDGITWNETHVESSLGNNVFVNGVVWGGNIWVISTTNTGYALGWSSDGITWHTANTGGIMNSGLGVAYNGTIFFAWGVGFYSCASSKDGKNWTGLNIPDNIGNRGQGIKDVTWNGTYWVVVISVNALTENRVAYSTDLITWFTSPSGNALYNQVQELGGITSRNRKNYYLTLF